MSGTGVAKHLRAAVTPGVGVAGVILLLSWFAVVSDDVLDSDGIAALDRPVLIWFVGSRDATLTGVMQVVTRFGDLVSITVLGIVAVLLAVWRMRRVWPLVLTGVALPGAGLLIVAGKALFGRERPPAEVMLVAISGGSFPSGHALGAIVAGGVFAYLAIRAVRSRWARVGIAVAAGTVASAIGLTRLYLGAHWLTDVVGSWTLGGAWLVVCLTGCHLLVRARSRLAGTGRTAAAPSRPCQ